MNREKNRERESQTTGKNEVTSVEFLRNLNNLKNL